MLKKALAIIALVLLASTGTARAQDYPPAINSLTANPSTVPAGGRTTLTARTFKAGTTVRFTRFSDPVVLGSAVADASGVAVLDATIPADTTAGSHRIEATGTGSTNVSLTVATDILVTRPGSSAIPQTGSNDTVPLATTGAVILAVGGLLVLVARRRRARAGTG